MKQRSAYRLGDRQARTQRKGFTLVEIMAASAIMLLVIVSVLGLTTHVLTTWTNASNQITSNADAAQAFEVICHDLESAVIKQNGNLWLETTTQSVSGTANTYNLYFYAPVTMRQTVDYTSNASGDTINGDICAVSYQVARQTIFGGTAQTSYRYGLYRAVIDPALTFDSGASSPVAGYSTFLPLATSTADTMNTTRLSNIWAAGAAYPFLGSDGKRASRTTPTFALSTPNLIGLRVVEFSVRAVFDDELANEEVYIDSPFALPIKDGATYTAKRLSNDGAANNVTYTSAHTFKGLLVSMTVINTEGENKLRYNSISGVNTDVLTDTTFKTRYTETFTRRINVKVQPY